MAAGQTAEAAADTPALVIPSAVYSSMLLSFNAMIVLLADKCMCALHSHLVDVH